MSASDPGGRQFYDTDYGDWRRDLNAEIRREAFGEEIGQSSWLTAGEQRHFCSLLELDGGSHLLEIASGSGGPALFTAALTGCEVTGIDLHEDAVRTANDTAAERGLAHRARFRVADARLPLAFDDASFDAVECIDSINHIYDRTGLLAEIYRVLRPGGRLLFTDPITVTGLLRREEMTIRGSGMGEFVFTAPGSDAAMLTDTGFIDIRTEDRTETTASVAMRWRAARDAHRPELVAQEGAEDFAAAQEFLAVAGDLALERRLSRIAYLAAKPTSSSDNESVAGR
jgi:cyclopropane fatty-acyl-phospholipid synthase-like methyltransferase